jgi:hypothetical protein
MIPEVTAFHIDDQRTRFPVKTELSIVEIVAD